MIKRNIHRYPEVVKLSRDKQNAEQRELPDVRVNVGIALAKAAVYGVCRERWGNTGGTLWNVRGTLWTGASTVCERVLNRTPDWDQLACSVSIQGFT